MTTLQPLSLEYSPAQLHAFFDSRELGRFRIFPKGRRVGFTQGAAFAAIEWMLEGHKVLWGDTLNGNIRRYIERYFLPTLQKNNIPYDYNIGAKIIRIGKGFCDFRSAENPENWEGFGYDKILLNEAGIILSGENGRYLYQNAVLPMMLDNPDSELIAFGAPKGLEGTFYDLYQKAVEGVEGYYTKTYSTHQNPWLSADAIAELEKVMFTVGGQSLVDQEINGIFISGEGEGLKIIPRAWLDLAVARWRATPAPMGYPDAIGLDIARGGKDHTAAACRWGDYIGALNTRAGRLTPDGDSCAAFVMPFLGPNTTVMIDVVGVGSSAYDTLVKAHPSTTNAFNGATRTNERDRTELFRFANLRAEAFWRLREALDPSNGATLCLPPDEEMAQDLCSAGYQIGLNGILVEPKEKIAKRIGRSPDKGDAVYMALAQPSVGFFGVSV